MSETGSHGDKVTEKEVTQILAGPHEGFSVGAGQVGQSDREQQQRAVLTTQRQFARGNDGWSQ